MLFFSACGEQDQSFLGIPPYQWDPDPTIGISVSPSTVTISLAQSQIQLFTAIISDYYFGVQKWVNWTVTGGVSGTTIDSNGRLTVAYDEVATILTVRASHWNGKYGEAIVTVLPIQIGPASGYIFYDKGSYSDGWRYLESAPASSEFTAPWGLYNVVCPGTGTGVGTGQANTTAIINILNAQNESNCAAQLCDALTINGYNDWFLPSKDELNLMYQRLRIGGNSGGFVISESPFPGSYYWTSSATVASTYTWYQRFNDGYQFDFDYFNYNGRTNELRVRGIRAF